MKYSVLSPILKYIESLKHAPAQANDSLLPFNRDQIAEVKRATINYNKRLSHDQQIALYEMKTGKNIHLYGEGGTGKSYVLKVFLEGLTDHQREHLILCAPTGVAAINIGGTTIHRVFKMPTEPLGPSGNKIDSSLLRAANIIVIDEIGMVRFDQFQFVARTIKAAEKKYHKTIQLIVIGDMLQIPPVITSKDQETLEELWGKDIGDGYAFQAPAWPEFEFVNCSLEQIMRQDEASEQQFIHNLNLARTGDKSCIKWFNQNSAKYDSRSIILCPKNEQARNENQKQSERFPNKKFYSTNINGNVKNEELKVDREGLSLAKGMRVMAIANEKDLKYVNGSLGTVDKTYADAVMVKFDNGNTCKLERMEWDVYGYKVVEENNEKKLVKYVLGSYSQLPLKVAYAITIHKSQGQTYDRVNINPRCFAKGQLYVALSRCRSIHHLHLVADIWDSNLIASDEAIRFYKEISVSALNYRRCVSAFFQKDESRNISKAVKTEISEKGKTVTKSFAAKDDSKSMPGGFTFDRIPNVKHQVHI